LVSYPVKLFFPLEQGTNQKGYKIKTGIRLNRLMAVFFIFGLGVEILTEMID
jgi:hypothetical protein